MKKQNPQVHNYIATEVNVFIEPLVYQIVLNRPSDPVQFAIEWLTEFDKKKKYRQKCRSRTVINSDTQEQLQDEVKNLQQKIAKKKSNRGNKSSRLGISEQVFGEFNYRDTIEVSQSNQLFQDQKVLVTALIRNSILFQNVDLKDEEIILRAIKSQQTEEYDMIIKEGECGNDFFIVSTGQYDCYKLINGQNVFVKTYYPGEGFGQLALMYNAPRAASIVTKVPGKLLMLDRFIFSQIIKVAALRKQKIIKNAIDKVQILKAIPQQHRYAFINILKEQKYAEGQYIIKEREEGQKFYIVLQGTLVAEKETLLQLPKIVLTYEEGDYFGQLALINNAPRKASVKAITKVKVACVTRQGFKRVFGSYQKQLKQKSLRYE